MKSKPEVQADFLEQIRRGRIPVTIYTANGFQLKGLIKAHDQFTLLVEGGNGQQSLVYKSAVSTIARTEQEDRR